MKTSARRRRGRPRRRRSPPCRRREWSPRWPSETRRSRPPERDERGLDRLRAGTHGLPVHQRMERPGPDARGSARTSRAAALTPAGAQPTGASPWGVAAHPSGRFVFVANREDATVSAFGIDAQGTLTPIGTYGTGGTWPYAAVVEPLGRFLFVGNNLGNSIAVFAIDGATGALTPVTGSPFAVPGRSRSPPTPRAPSCM